MQSMARAVWAIAGPVVVFLLWPAVVEGAADRISICHRSGAGVVVLLKVPARAAEAHLRHGDQLVTAVNETGADCVDGLDNDCDGAVDCADASCASDPLCECDADCDGDGVIGEGELDACVKILLGEEPLSVCPACDRNQDAAVTILDCVLAQ